VKVEELPQLRAYRRLFNHQEIRVVKAIEAKKQGWRFESASPVVDG
jgi:hypothetical protein